MKKLIYIAVIGYLFVFASQAGAHELRVLSGENSQNSMRWQQEVFPDYGHTELGKTLPATIISIRGAGFPPWLNEALEDGRAGEILGTPTFLIWDSANQREVGRVEGYTQKERFYLQMKEAVAMVEKGLTPGRREGSGGDMRREEGSGMSQDIMDHVYKTPEEAKRASEMLGLGGEIHSHQTPEGTIYMPGPMM